MFLAEKKYSDVFFFSVKELGGSYLIETCRYSRIWPNKHRRRKFSWGYLGKRAVINHGGRSRTVG